MIKCVFTSNVIKQEIRSNTTSLVNHHNYISHLQIVWVKSPRSYVVQDNVLWSFQVVFSRDLQVDLRSHAADLIIYIFYLNYYFVIMFTLHTMIVLLCLFCILIAMVIGIVMILFIDIVIYLLILCVSVNTHILFMSTLCDIANRPFSYYVLPGSR